MIRYIIIDDEPIAHDIIKDYCNQLPNLKLQKHCYDAIEAMQFLSRHEVDLLFLDLNMPKLKGFDFLKTLLHPPKVIVTTAYKEFALDGYELNVVDYLLKPFSFERFLKAINKINSPVKKSPSPSQTKMFHPLEQRIFLKGDKKHTQIIISNILFLEAAGNYTKVMTEATRILTRERISAVLAMLPPKDFLQVHKIICSGHQTYPTHSGKSDMD